MVSYKKHTLSNGLRVLVHRDETTPMATVNVLYDVGSRDEDPGRTGFAHLFEHLMFEGSVNIADYDYHLQRAGGENNAFTTNDLTSYYINLPAQNLETAFWLESDRMLGLDFSEEKLTTQKKVVTEEYRQSYLNQPYGDAWKLLRPLIYEVHPYRWDTIGKSIDHIQQASLQDVQSFFTKFYHPGNAILSVAGNVDAEKVFALAEKWFGSIPSGVTPERKLPAEPPQQQERRLRVERDVPQHQVYMAFRMEGRLDPGFYASDLISDILANGESARLNTTLVYDQKHFSDVNAFVTGNIDPGMLVITGKPHSHLDPPEAEQLLWREIQRLTETGVDNTELQKVINKVEAAHTFSESSVMAKALNLAYYELLGDASILNSQMEEYAAISARQIKEQASAVLVPEKASILQYNASSENR
ncbi:MAG: pitrilysin family protein [Bacteroidales bacterium]